MKTPIEPKKTLLIITVGHTDVQLVKGDVRYELGGKCGILHDEIKSRSDWVLVDSPRKNNENKRVAQLPVDKFQLCTPKLDAILQWFMNQSRTSDSAEEQCWLPYAALIVETRRKQDDNDPRFAGRILARRLRECGVSEVVPYVMLEQDGGLEGTELQDRVIRRRIVEALDEVIDKQIEEGKPQRVVLATTGGLAAANEVVSELARLHSVGKAKVVALKVADGSRKNEEDFAVEEAFHPAAGFCARWHALSLIEKGNFLAAWGAVQHLEKVPGQQRWVGVVKQLADFAASLPLDDACKFSVLKHPRMAVRTALRVELALRAGDIPRAVHGTVAFFESALWDKLNERVECVIDERRLYRFIGELPHQELIGTGKNQPFHPNKSGNYSIYDRGHCMVNIAEKYLIMTNLTTGAKILIEKGIRDLRNDVAHKEPTPELMGIARSKMRQAGLWSEHDTFLSQPIVQGVLRELDVEAPEGLCEDLLRQVRQVLLDVTMPDV